MAWSEDDIPDQSGRVAVVTGANTGIGFETARALARRGARVVLACRSADKGREAVGRIVAAHPAAQAELVCVDLSDLESVAAFAERILTEHERLDLLIHNAGVMVPPFSRTKQGFELQFGTNHLGHFALGARLLPRLQATAGSRLVVVYSGVYRGGRIDFDDPNYERRPYRASLAYAQSKLANLVYAFELSRRLGDAGPRVTAAHPGWTATDLQRTTALVRMLNPLVAMKPADGALPTLRAATDPAAEAGSLWGPSGLFEGRGPPEPAHVSAWTRDPELGQRLWELSERLTGTRYPFVARAA